MGRKLDTAIHIVFFFILGLLCGAVLSGSPLSPSDISSASIAIAALYGVLKWRAQHDYQVEKADRKKLIALVKKMTFHISEIHVSISLLNKNLTSYIRQKNEIEKAEFNASLVRRTLERLEKANGKLNEIYSEIEAEAYTNYLTNKNHKLRDQVLLAAVRAQDFIITANAMTSVCENFEMLEADEEDSFDDIESQVEKELIGFLAEIVIVEKMLDIHVITKAKTKGTKELQKKDNTPKRQS